jgi:hypothetical protein
MVDAGIDSMNMDKDMHRTAGIGAGAQATPAAASTAPAVNPSSEGSTDTGTDTNTAGNSTPDTETKSDAPQEEHVEDTEQLQIAPFRNVNPPPAAVNPLVIDKPYPATIYGVESARMQCRFMMNRIVMEVDKVACYPEIATDESRPLPYMSPFLFNMLLPVSVLSPL